MIKTTGEIEMIWSRAGVVVGVDIPGFAQVYFNIRFGDLEGLLMPGASQIEVAYSPLACGEATPKKDGE